MHVMARRGSLRRSPAHLVAALGVGIAATAAPAGTDWPTLRRDNQRSGYTEELVEGPYRRLWWRDFHDEMVATRCEAIVAGRRVFVGTFAGRLHALDTVTGETLWTHAAAGPIGASPCYRAGRILAGSDDAFDRGTLHCLRASDGRVLWQYSAPAGIWTSPACDGERVYFGDRSGRLHAVGLEDGAPAWTFRTGSMILQPVSLSADGQKIVVGSEDLHVYCLDSRGRLLWKSPKLPGLSMRDHAPAIWRGLAIVRTNPADSFHTVLGRHGELLEAIQREIPIEESDAVLLDKWGDLLLAPRPERRKAELRGVLEYLDRHPRDQTFHAFELEDGSRPWTAPVLYTAGLHNPPTPPTFHPQTGELYTLWRTALTHYVRGVRRYSGLVQLDRESGRPLAYWPEEDERNWRAFPMIPDETQALSLMGRRVVGTHQGVLGMLDPETGSATPVWRGRDTYAGIFGPGALDGRFEEAERRAREGYLTGMPNEWHGPDRGVVSIAGGRIFWLAGSQLVCIGGPDAEVRPSGGTEPPEPFRNRLPDVAPGGNVASRGAGGYDASLERRELSPDDLRPWLEPPARPDRSRHVPRASRLRQRLEATVREVVDEAPWAPFIVELGISGEERHFSRTALDLEVLSRALPWCSPELREDTVAHLDRLVADGAPLEAPSHSSDGDRREPYELGPGMTEFAQATPRSTPGVRDLYGLWCYAHYAGRWEAVLERLDAIEELFAAFGTDVSRFDPHDMEHDGAQRLNARIAGVLGAARIFDRAGLAPRREQALELLAGLVTDRVHHERADHRLVRPTRSTSKDLHAAKVPRYLDLSPELAAMLRRYAGEALERHVTALRHALPLWYQAYGERMIGGENWISPPHLARGIFAVWADGLRAPLARLAAKLDQPWCRADLYYIEKLTATLRAAGRGA